MYGSSPSSAKIVWVSADKFAKFSQYHKPEKESASTNLFAESNKTCLITFSNKWLIDLGSINHMTGYSNIFSSFRSHKTPFMVTIADGSTCNSLGSGTVKPTSSITLSSILSLPKLAFNWNSVCKLTRTLSDISFFLGHCLFHELTKNRVIGKYMYLMISTSLMNGNINFLPALVLCLHLKHIVDWVILLYFW